MKVFLSVLISMLLTTPAFACPDTISVVLWS